MYAVLTVNPDTVAADVVAAMSAQPPEVRLDVGSHLYWKSVARLAAGLSSQSRSMLVPMGDVVKFVGRHGPLVV